MKIKEKILKLGKKKNCFIALLLCVLLAFTIISGLNGSKSCEIKANAQTALQTKNLDLNGVRYTYQTSLNELKKKYKLFSHWAYENFIIKEDSEGLLELYLAKMQNINNVYNDTQWNDIQEIIKNSFSIEYDNILTESIISTNENKNVGSSIFEFENAPAQSEITGIKINFNNLLTIPFLGEYVTNSLDYINIIYVNKNNSNDYIVYTYVNISKSNEIYIKFKNIKNYSVMGICGLRNGTLDEVNDENTLYGMGYPEKNFALSEIQSSTTEGYYFIDELNFNEKENYITFKNLYGGEKPYHGNILLSDTNSGEDFLKALTTTGGNKVQNFDGGAIFGGDFNNNKLINSFNYVNELGAIVADTGDYTGLNNQGALFRFNSPIVSPKVVYFNQNKIMYLPKFSDLRCNFDSTTYSGLSSQVEDILYNLDYIGTSEEIFNEKVEEDFQNLLKLTGLGAFIGLVLGLIFGNPALGAAIGAMWGALIALFPLLIDGLQALFGYNFLSGLYNFFKSITNFFANFVDTIINFLVSIITNPFVLILIVIVAIIFVITYFQKK